LPDDDGLGGLGWVIPPDERTEMSHVMYFHYSHTIQYLECVDYRWVKFVDKVPVVDGNADAVEAERFKEACVLAREEVLEKPVEEKVVLLLPKNLQHGSSHFMLMARVAGDEVLHVGMATRGTLQPVSLAMQSS